MIGHQVRATHLCLNLVSVVLVNDLLNGSRDQDVTLLVQQVISLVCLSTGETHDGAVLNLPVLKFLRRND